MRVRVPPRAPPIKTTSYALRAHFFLISYSVNAGIGTSKNNDRKLTIRHLKHRGFYDKALDLQKKKGDAALLKALAAPLDGSKLAQVFTDEVMPAEQDLVLISGVGNAYPLVRTHNLLNNLHHQMGSTPLVLFYPGVYDGQSLRLFGILQDKPYYRAFRLVD